MIRIKRVIFREIQLPLKEPFVISSGVQELRRIFLLEVHDHDGHVAWSECVAQEYPNYSSETIETAWLALREWLVPLVLGRSFDDPTEISRHLNADVRGHRMAKAALEMACWHVAAIRQNVPLATLLGGTRPRIPVGISVGIQPNVRTLVDKVAGYREQGYRKIKLKIRPGADRTFLEAVRDAYGDELPLAVDANSAYTLGDLQHLLSFDEFGLMMLEQPLQHDDLVRHARLQQSLRTPICLDESITSVERVEDMISLGSGKIVNIKPGRVGGLAASKRIHELCTSQDIPVWCGGMLESGVGRAYNVALASLPKFTIPGDISPSSRYWGRDIVDPEWTMSPDGFIDVPLDRPGLGVVVNQDRVDDLTHRMEVVT